MRRFIDNDRGPEVIQGVVVFPVPGEPPCRYRVNGRELRRARQLRVTDRVGSGGRAGQIVGVVEPVMELPEGPCSVSDDTGIYGLFRVRLDEPDAFGRAEQVWSGRGLRLITKGTQ